MVTVNIKTITPVHIGTGDVYMSSEYFQDRETINNREFSVFKRIDLIKYFNSLNHKDQEEFSKNLLNDKYKSPKVSDDYLRYFSFNRCETRPNPGRQIAENIKVMDKPYIPGSSLKGAIETALLYNSLTHEEITDIFRNDEIDLKFADKFFSSTGNPQNSILRFLQISDSTTATRPYIYDIKTIKANKNGGFSKVFNLYYETLLASKLSSSININYDSNTFEKLNLVDREYLLDLNYIKKSVYEFSNDYMQFELDFMKKYGEDHPIVENLYKFYKKHKKLNSIDSPYLKIGSNTGFLASTLAIKIKHFDSFYFNKVKKSLNGKKARHDFPVTRRILNKSSQPVGWVQLSFK